VEALDDFFQYHGTSIRIGGSSNGIRFFSSVNEADANKLMAGTLTANHKGVANALSGAKMTSTGTEFWKTEDNKLRSEVYGGAVGNSFRTFQKYQGRNWYTGVLVGLEGTGSAVKDLISTRPYAIVQIDGKTVTLYGGLMARSIYYVAWQNRDTFNGTIYDNYVEALIKMGQ